MKSDYKMRLTVLGSARVVTLFRNRSEWRQRLKARFVEIFEQSPKRHVWWFEAPGPFEPELKRLSSNFSGAVLFLEWENESRRSKGVIKASGGKLNTTAFEY